MREAVRSRLVRLPVFPKAAVERSRPPGAPSELDVRPFVRHSMVVTTNTIRAARSRTAGEYLVLPSIAPPFRETEPPGRPERSSSLAPPCPMLRSLRSLRMGHAAPSKPPQTPPVIRRRRIPHVSEPGHHAGFRCSAPSPTRGAPGFLTRDGIWAADESCAIGLIRVIGPKTRVIPGMPESMVTR